MVKGNRRAVKTELDRHRLSAETLATTIRSSADLLAAVYALRARGETYSAAVASVLEERELSVLRVGWELWHMMAVEEGLDTESLVLEIVPKETLEATSVALWGSVRPPFYCSGPRLRVCDDECETSSLGVSGGPR